MPVLLLCSVGGSPEPVVTSLIASKPDRVIFIASRDTAREVENKILPEAVAQGVVIGPGQYDIRAVDDAQDFAGCTTVVRARENEIREWLGRGNDYSVLVDFTGGTKCMSAAIALVARNWSCTFSYVGGNERTKGGVGVVVSGREMIFHTENPWNSLGYQAVDEAIVLFDQLEYEAAGRLLKSILPRITAPDVRQEIAALQNLAVGYREWDRFAHKAALTRFTDVLKNMNNLRHLLGEDKAENLSRQVREHVAFLEQLVEAQDMFPKILDLLANARRRLHQGRFDDAVARLYRSIEALAQHRLKAGYGIADTGKVPLEIVPEPLRAKWASRAGGEGKVRLALQDGYELLRALGDPMGDRFVALGLADREKSPLSQRNRSILAHGFDPVPEKVFHDLWRAVLDLGEIKESDLLQFPTLSENH